ncbi:MAG TPA: OsmC family protein, partial [Mycobacteriales bacterium]|nr:OsmC family protein [Mycobacteriales bacterium]
MSDRIHVDHDRNDRFTVQVRGHTVAVDQPVDNGGDDTAATPTELFLAALAACVAFYGRRFLARHGIAADGLAVDLDYTAGGRPNRVTGIEIRVTPPPGLPPERRAAFLAVA